MNKLILSILAGATLLWSAAVLAADLVVSAASSLTNAFTDIGKAYEKARPGSKVLFNFAASGQLLQQIARGAPVDVFASADQETMDRAAKRNLLVKGTRKDFVRNKLVVVVPGDAGTHLKSLEGLKADAIRRIAVANPETVPVGRYAKQSLEGVGLWDLLQPKYINTGNVRQSLDYVSRGEVDAGFVYLTDAQIMPNRLRVAFEVPLASGILYPVAAVKGNGNENGARDFLAFLDSEAARKILQTYGFGVP